MGSKACPRRTKKERHVIRSDGSILFPTRRGVRPKITVLDHSVARIAVLARDVHRRPVKPARGSHLLTSLVVTLLKSLDACHLIGGLRW